MELIVIIRISGIEFQLNPSYKKGQHKRQAQIWTDTDKADYSVRICRVKKISDLSSLKLIWS